MRAWPVMPRLSFCKMVILVAVAAMLGATLRPSAAEDWPSRPITLMVSFTPGGMTDFISRTIAQDLSATLGQPVVVEFKSGGGGVVGLLALNKAEPDGYTLLVTATGPLVFRPLIDKTVTYDADKDFTPIILIGDTPNAVMVSPKLGVKTVKDLVAYADTKQHRLTFAHPGPGTMGQLCGILLARETHIEGTFISYRGASQIITDLLGGQIDIGTPAYGPGMDAVILAVASDQRMESQPNLPTLKDFGVDVVCSTWLAIYAPPDMPRPLVLKLNAAIDAILRKPEVHEKFSAIGLRVLGGSPDQPHERVVEDRSKWSDILKGVNFDLPK